MAKKETKKEKKIEKIENKHHMKRWEIYSLITLIVLVIGVALYGAYYYVNNVLNDNFATQNAAIEVQRTSEENDLDKIKKDIEDDSSLDMSDVDNELKELDSIDLSGV